jgi:hypothetical protein
MCTKSATLTEWTFRLPRSLSDEGERQRIDQVAHTLELIYLRGGAILTTLDMSAESVSVRSESKYAVQSATLASSLCQVAVRNWQPFICTSQTRPTEKGTCAQAVS